MELLTRINWVDILVVIVILRISYIAFQEGLSHEIFPLFGAIFTISLTLHYYNGIAACISNGFKWIPLTISGFLIFVALIIGIGFVFKILKTLLDKIIKVTWHPIIERFGGLIVGALRSLLAASIILLIIVHVPLSYLQWAVKDRSLTGKYFLGIAPAVYERVAVFLPAAKKIILEASVTSEAKKAK